MQHIGVYQEAPKVSLRHAIVSRNTLITTSVPEHVVPSLMSLLCRNEHVSRSRSMSFTESRWMKKAAVLFNRIWGRSTTPTGTRSFLASLVIFRTKPSGTLTFSLVVFMWTKDQANRTFFVLLLEMVLLSRRSFCSHRSWKDLDACLKPACFRNCPIVSMASMDSMATCITILPPAPCSVTMTFSIEPAANLHGKMIWQDFLPLETASRRALRSCECNPMTATLTFSSVTSVRITPIHQT